MRVNRGSCNTSAFIIFRKSTYCEWTLQLFSFFLSDRRMLSLLQASALHLMGIDHERLTYRHQGRLFRLTDVHGEVVKGLLG
ncbi:MAG: DUF1501 domain-containing protein [Saprospiraceae bacterium]|nr:DUF1501 domain-containing protein [Saprospiraceae bacterium]